MAFANFRYFPLCTISTTFSFTNRLIRCEALTIEAYPKVRITSWVVNSSGNIL